MWVVDGLMYDKKEIAIDLDGNYTKDFQLYHCVWGWGGQTNGWFRLNNKLRQFDNTGYQLDNPEIYCRPDSVRLLVHYFPKF